MKRLIEFTELGIFNRGNVGEKTPLKYYSKDGYLRVGDIVAVSQNQVLIGLGIVCCADPTELKLRKAHGERIVNINTPFYYISGYYDKCCRDGKMVDGYSVSIIESYAIIQSGECYDGVHVVDTDVNSIQRLQNAISSSTSAREFRG